ncbi:MAG: carboxypeptidase regulatory-like domain-containing protein, partial [Planctomycetes bacterium]|nr:carboxypeptidase regulatory-like domain-containing protein [Planctomycetota bacterium]
AAATAAGSIVSTDPRWATALAGSTRVPDLAQSTVVVAPRVELSGRVVDTDGRPLAGAVVQVHLPSHFGAEFGIVLDYSVRVSWKASCDQDGRFVLHDVAAVAQAQLSATLGGYLPRFIELPASSPAELELVLVRPGVGAAKIAGLVVDESDALVADARVSAGGAVSRTDERGAFTIDLSNGETLGRITAVAKGMQPAVLVPDGDANGRTVWPARVVLRLGPPPLSITGRVLDRNRRPIEGVRVWVDDPTVVGFDGETTMLAETFLGREDRPFWAFVVTDGSGTFRLDGLLDRAYVVRALDPVTLRAVTREGVPAGGNGVDLQLAAATFPELRGRIVARDGAPLAGITVKLTRPALSVRIPGHPDSSMFEWASSAAVQTDRAGEFAFADVPTEGVTVTASGETILVAYGEIVPGIDPLAFELKVERRMHLQVEVGAPADRADEIQVLDATDRPMLLVIMRGGARTQRFRFALLDGRSEVLTLGEDGRNVVLLKHGVEVGRMPVQLQAGQVNTIRF